MAEQTKLLTKYKDIEGLPDWPLHIDLKESQIIIKDFIGRITEELAEAEEYYRNKDFTIEAHGELAEEELIDALHFFLNLLIVVGPSKVYPTPRIITLPEQDQDSTLTECLSNLYYELNIARNDLKNKPWKQSEVQTNKESFYKHIFLTGYWFSVLFSSVLGWDDERLWSEYMKKHTINKFRQRSNY